MDRLELIKKDFESLFYSLDYFIDNAQSANAEDVFETISHLLSDIHDLTGKKGIKNYQVNNVENYAYSIFNLMRTTSDSFSLNREKVNDFDTGLAAELKNQSKKVTDAENELEPICNLVEEKRKIDSSLKEKLALLESKKLEVENLESEISELDKQIVKLNSISVEDLKKKADSLRVNKNEKEQELESIENRISSLDGEISELDKKTKTMKETVEKNESEKIRLLDEEESLKNELSDFRKWKEEFDKNHKIISRDIVNAQNALTIIHDAWERINNRPDLPDIMQNYDGFKQVNSEIDSYEKMTKWFENMSSGIQQAMDYYMETYTSLLPVIPK